MAYLTLRRGDSAAIFASAARTATPTADTFQVPAGTDGLIVIIDITAVTSTPSTVFTIVGVDLVSGKTWTVLASAAQTGTATLVLRVCPHLTAVNNTIAKDIVPAFFTVTAVHGNANSMTYSVAAQAA